MGGTLDISPNVRGTSGNFGCSSENVESSLGYVGGTLGYVQGTIWYVGGTLGYVLGTLRNVGGTLGYVRRNFGMSGVLWHTFRVIHGYVRGILVFLG